ncbi:MAG TPA: amidase family protein [Thermoanaerobaculia bacterium]|nr:amidase family protein [Thermoanaerobaculia bacterium]
MRTNRRDFLRLASRLTLSGPALAWLGACSPRPQAAAVAAGSELAGFDGVALAELVRKGEVTPLELLDDALRRIDAVNPQIAAVLPDLFDVEIARVRAAGPRGTGPLSGVPVLLKNLIPYKDARITSGSRLEARRIEQLGRPVDEQNHELVDAMQRTGMIIAGITNSPEFGLIDSTEPVLHGPTRNPWSLEHTTGGSSGGSAAAVAAGVVPLAHANDGGGSIRIPASHCGLFGLKPTRAREAGNVAAGDGAILAISSNLCVSRSVRDSAAFLASVERSDNPELPPVGFVTGPSKERRRIAVVLHSLEGTAPEPEVETGALAAARLCEELGHRVETVEPPFDGPAFIDAFIGFWAGGAAQIVDSVPELLGPEASPESYLEPWTLGLAELANSRGVEQCVLTALQVFSEVARAVDGLFESHDLLLSPTLRTPPFRIGDHDPTVDFDTLLPRVIDVVGYTPIHNAVGTPAMSMPLHWTESGLPVGVQIAAARGGERTLFELAYELEEARPWRDRRPPVSAT